MIARNTNAPRSEKRGCWRRNGRGKGPNGASFRLLARMHDADPDAGYLPPSPRIIKRRMMAERRRERGFSRGEATMLGIYCERFSKTAKVRRRLGKFLRKYRKQVRNERRRAR